VQVKQRESYVVEGRLEIGPEELPLVFVEGEELGGLLLRRFPLSPDQGYYRLGRVRVTVERLEE
jgi:hypothetical protein